MRQIYNLRESLSGRQGQRNVAPHKKRDPKGFSKPGCLLQIISLALYIYFGVGWWPAWLIGILPLAAAIYWLGEVGRPIICTKCGKKVPKNAAQCPHCGVKYQKYGV